MKKIQVTIFENQQPTVFKSEIASTMKGSNFKEYIAREMVRFSDVDFHFAITCSRQQLSFARRLTACSIANSSRSTARSYSVAAQFIAVSKYQIPSAASAKNLLRSLNSLSAAAIAAD